MAIHGFQRESKRESGQHAEWARQRQRREAGVRNLLGQADVDVLSERRRLGAALDAKQLFPFSGEKYRKGGRIFGSCDAADIRSGLNQPFQRAGGGRLTPVEPEAFKVMAALDPRRRHPCDLTQLSSLGIIQIYI
jgi:hypothetical protein